MKAEWAEEKPEKLHGSPWCTNLAFESLIDEIGAHFAVPRDASESGKKVAVTCGGVNINPTQAFAVRNAPQQRRKRKEGTCSGERTKSNHV